MDYTPEILAGGNASGPVVRVGKTVRKPWESQTGAVHQFLRLLRANGVDVPEPIGRDDQGRQVIEFVAGKNALTLMPLGLETLRSVGLQVRQIHDASDAFDISDLDPEKTLLPVDGANLMCHNDLAPWNFIVGERNLFIDWDGAGPSTRLWDLAYAAQSFAMLNAGEPVDLAVERLQAFVEGYGAEMSLRAALPDAMYYRASAMFEMLKRSNREGLEPWGTMFVEGHGEHWRMATQYVRQNRLEWVVALR